MASDMFDIDPQEIPAKPYCSCEMPDSLRALEYADPNNDAKAAIAAGDYRLRSTASTGVAIAGERDTELLKELGEVVIDDTSDVLKCYEHARLNLIAQKYAYLYNLVILDGYKR